jgi:DMSO/TMAO reductase YedYZ molybdopterin-dependent catalytic subunit
MMKRKILVRAALAGIYIGLVYSQSHLPPSTSATLSITGDVPSPLHLAIDDLARMPRETVSVRDANGASTSYEGVPLRELLAHANAPLGKNLRGKALSTYVLAKARDGYQVVFTLAEVDAAFANESILVADKRDGKPLPPNQGPLRIVCPNDKAGARSVRMLETLQVVSVQH